MPGTSQPRRVGKGAILDVDARGQNHATNIETRFYPPYNEPSGGLPNTRSAARWNRTSAVRHQISTMMMRMSWNPAISVESSPSTLPVSTISAMPAGAMASTMVGTGYPASHAIAAANSAIEPAANSTTIQRPTAGGTAG